MQPALQLRYSSHPQNFPATCFSVSPTLCKQLPLVQSLKVTLHLALIKTESFYMCSSYLTFSIPLDTLGIWRCCCEHWACVCITVFLYIPRVEFLYPCFCWWTSKYKTKQGLNESQAGRQGRPWTSDPPVSVFQALRLQACATLPFSMFLGIDL